MAEVTLRRCDVFETVTKEVKPVTIIMRGQKGEDPEAVELFAAAQDMSPRAVKRALGFLRRATSPPPPKAKADA